MSAKEEKDLQTLLEMFALGVGDVEEFQERLQAELAALEVRPCIVLSLASSNVFKRAQAISENLLLRVQWGHNADCCSFFKPSP